MATFHLTAKAISRSSGSSSTGSSAYRSGEKITDERTGQVHDYTKKGGVLHSEIILPEGGTIDRSKLWNAVENHHKRGDAVVAREVEVSLPTELNEDERQALAVGFARELSDRYGVAADVALHAPRTVTDKDLEKDPEQYHETDPETGRRHNGNWHAHIMLSACHASPTGELGKKAVELDPIHCQRAKIENMADRERVRWEQLANSALERAGHGQRIDHRSLKAQGIEREPTKHLGPAASEYERRTGKPSRKRLDFNQDAARRLAIAKEAGELEREGRQLDRSIIDLSGDLSAAKAERDRQPTTQAKPTIIPPTTQAKQIIIGSDLSVADKKTALSRLGGQGATLILPRSNSAYSGKIMQVSDTHIVQQTGKNAAVVHEIIKLSNGKDLLKLDDAGKLQGKGFDFTYGDKTGAASPSLSQPKEAVKVEPAQRQNTKDNDLSR